jgi:hypothetical protein
MGLAALAIWLISSTIVSDHYSKAIATGAQVTHLLPRRQQA